MEHINESIKKAKKQVKEMEKAGIYQPEHIEEVKEQNKKEIVSLVKEYHENVIAELKTMQNDVILKHDPKAAVIDPERPATKYIMGPEKKYAKLLQSSPEMYKIQVEMDERRGIFSYDVNGNPIVDGEVKENKKTSDVRTKTEVQMEAAQQLLENRKMEAEVKAARTSDLEAELENISRDKSGNIERLNFVAAELRTRGKHETADALLDRVEAYNVKQPWRNDPDFIAAEKRIIEEEGYLTHSDDFLFIGENGDNPISLQDIWQETEAEKQAKHDQEVAEAKQQ